jgi:hypothetical protein
MALDIPGLIHSVVATAKAIVSSALVDVEHIMVTGRDQWGTTWAEPVTRQAIVEDVGDPVVGDDGNERLSTSKLTFIEPIPVDMFDKFVVNGVESDVAKRKGVLQPDGTMSYVSEVWLGRRGGNSG